MNEESRRATAHIARDAFEKALICDWLTRKLDKWREFSDCRARLGPPSSRYGRWPLIIQQIDQPDAPSVVGWVWMSELITPHRLVGGWELPDQPGNPYNQTGAIEYAPVIDWDAAQA